MMLREILPELLADVEGALVRLGRGRIADELREARLASWSHDEFAQATYLCLGSPRESSPADETVCLFDEIGVNVDIDERGVPVRIEVFGYEDVLSRLKEEK